MSGDYHKDYDDGLWGNPVGDTYSPGYIAGETERQLRQQAGNGGSAMHDVGVGMAEDFRSGRIRFYVRWLAQTAVFSLVVGLLAYGLASIEHKSSQETMQWGLTAGAVTAGFLLVILAAFTVGVLLGVALNLVFLPIVLWRWVLAFGALGAGAGYLLATTASRTSTSAQQQAIEFGIKGVIAGLVLGVLYRLSRRLTRRARPQT